MSDDLVKRLRDLNTTFEGQGGRHYSAALFAECADRIEAQAAEIERLRDLLNEWTGLARDHLDTELAGRTFEALERTRK